MFVGLSRKSVGPPTATEATPRPRKNVSPRMNKKLDDSVRRINVFLSSGLNVTRLFSQPRRAFDLPSRYRCSAPELSRGAST